MKTLMLLCSLFTVMPAASIQTKIVGVKSGSTLEILSQGNVTQVKLYGIDCLAKTATLGKSARHFIAEQAFMVDVTLEIMGTETDGTIIGKVTLPDGRDLSVELLKSGLAWWDKQGSPDEKGLANLEQEARTAFLGVWGTPEDDDPDYGKEILARRDLEAKGAAGVLTAANN